MQYATSIAIDNVIEALGAFVQPFVGATQIIRAQENRAAMPHRAFVELTELLTVDLETPAAVTDAANSQVTITGPKRVDVQVDFYGPAAGDWCNAVKGVYRTGYAAPMFPDGIKPLYCSDAHQAPLIDAEQQYESRWTVTASLQYNPCVSLPQQFANKLALHTLEDLH